MTTVTLRSASAITAALLDERLVPPPGPQTAGATTALRAAMARFSDPGEHAPRRAAVVHAIDSIDLERAIRAARERTAGRLAAALAGPDGIEVIGSLGRPVAVEAVACGLGIADDASDLDGLVADIDAVVDVIGRGTPPGRHSDDAVGRVQERLATHPLGWVPVTSALYQSMDATATLVAVRLLDDLDGAPRTLPVARTVRVAAAPVGAIPAGARVDLELGAADMWFGAGPHACPGRAVAEAIADSMANAVRAAGATVDVARTTIADDRRPLAVWIV